MKLKQIKNQSKNLLISLAAYTICQAGWVGFLPNPDGSQKDGRTDSLGSNEMEVCVLLSLEATALFVLGESFWDHFFPTSKVLDHGAVAEFRSQVNSGCSKRQALAAERAKQQKEKKAAGKTTSQQRWFKKPMADAGPI